MPHPRPADNRVFMKANLLWIEVVGDQTKDTVRAMGEEITALVTDLRAQKRPVLIMDDVTRICCASPDALMGVALLARIVDYDKAAMVDTHTGILKTTINLILASIKRTNAHYFSEVAPAQAWLEEPSAKA